MEDLLQDLRYGVRILIRRPVFTTVAVLSLALGIGANTAIFSLVNVLLWRTAPVAHPETLVGLFTRDEKNPGYAPLSHLNWKDYQAMCQSFSGVLGYHFVAVSLQSGKEPVRIVGQLVSGNYFDLLGIRAAQGRTFLPEEASEPHPVVVVSHRFWKENLDGDVRAVGKAITINGGGYIVIGIAPESFTGTDPGVEPRFWIPMAMNPQIQPNKAVNWYETRRGLFVSTLARLKPGVSPAKAQAEVTTIAQRLRRDYPADNKGRSIQIVPLAQTVLGGPDARQGILAGTGLLLAVVGLVLLIACANVSNLLLAQAAVRRREIAIRLSQGAARGRLIRQLLTESLLLALLGGAVGLLVAMWAQELLPKLIPAGPFPLQLRLPLDGRVLAFTLGVALLTGLLFGLMPALQASRADLVSALKNQAQMEIGRPSRLFGVRGALVAGQVALSLVSLIVAGLFVRSLGKVQSIDPGFPAERLAVVSFDVGLQGWNQGRGEQFYRDVRERIAGMPGVAAVALGQAGPFQGPLQRSVFLEGQESDNDGVLMPVNTVAPEYFGTVGIEIRRGRGFTAADRSGAPGVVIVNETMAERFWPGKDPIGKRFHFFGDNPVEVVGVARNIKYNNPAENPRPYIYEPLAQRYITNVTLVVRSVRSPDSVLPAVQREIRAMAPTMPLVGASTVPDLLARSLWVPRAGTSLLALFGFLALGLASVGLYGVMSFSVTQRSRELGVRMALGAQHGDVLRLVIRQGLTVVGVGLVAGLLLAFGTTRLVAGMLFGVSPTDPTAFVVTSAVLTLAAFGATLIPALRVVSIHPILAIRYE